jgi:hypothetical protein
MSAARELRCAVPAHRCTGPGPVQLHHLLGRGADGRYVEPELLIPLCQPDDHQLGVHAVLKAAGVDGPMGATPGVIVGRVACAFGWLAWDRQGDITLPGEFLASVADVLGGVGRALRHQEAVK